MPALRWKDLNKTEREALRRWRNGWGARLWARELIRLWRGVEEPLDTLYTDEDSRAVLVSLRDKYGAHMRTVRIPSPGPID